MRYKFPEEFDLFAKFYRFSSFLAMMLMMIDSIMVKNQSRVKILSDLFVDFPYVCKCGNKYKYIKGLKEHQKWSCEYPAVCETCNRRYKTLHALRNHVYFGCPNVAEKKHACPKCDYKGRQKVHCRTCGKGYKHDSSLYRHRRFECDMAARPFPCTICNKNFKRKDHLLRHSLFIHGIRANT
ncbi:hypothetical protein HUJ04_008563 [Dendroctonus ponderosae]|nr:hypothetical protein HUJ04_008563 [Dendroctonus ponderosae]